MSILAFARSGSMGELGGVFTSWDNLSSLRAADYEMIHAGKGARESLLKGMPLFKRTRIAFSTEEIVEADLDIRLREKATKLQAELVDHAGKRGYGKPMFFRVKQHVAEHA